MIARMHLHRLCAARFIRARHLLLLGFAGLLAFTGCRQAQSPEVLARVGETVITTDDVRAEIDRRRRANRPVPAKEDLLQEMIDYQALLHRARHMGLPEDPEVKRELNNLLVGKLLERELAPRRDAVDVTDQEIKAEYEQNREKYGRPAKIRLALLYLECSAKSSEAKRAETRARLEEARRQVLTNPPSGGRGAAAGGFGALAIECSDDQASRFRGGDIGWLEPGASYRWPHEVLEAGFALEKNQVSAVLELEAGMYLVMKTDSREAAITPLEQVEAGLRQRVLVRKQRALDEAFRKESVQQARTIIYREVLAAFQPPPSTGAVAQARNAVPSPWPGPIQDNAEH